MHAWLIPLSQAPLAGILFAFGQSNLAGQVIVAFLFVGSIVVWSVMATKIREIVVAQRASERFLLAYRKELHPTALFRKGRNLAASPLGIMYVQACEAMDSNAAEPGAASSERRLSAARINAARSAAERTAADQTLRLEDGMGFLATATTTAPFLGLLGTVWGVMEAFQGMGESALLSAVAPGISGALMTTVVGLLVALPSAIGYNTLSGRIRRLSVMMDNFCQELASDFETHAAEGGA